MLAGLLVARASSVAFADHEMAMSEHHHDDSSEISVGVSMEAAAFSTMVEVGNYQGILPSLGWMRGRFGASATVGLYHLDENGLSVYGMGDTMIAGHATVVATETAMAGVALYYDTDGGKASNAHVGVFGVGDCQRRLAKAEGALNGHTVDEMLAVKVGEAAAAEVEPQEDIHASAAYRRALTGTLTERALKAAAAR